MSPGTSMIGRVVDQYRITEYIGSGAMGDVYKGQHLFLDHTAAFKFIKEHLLADAAARKQFIDGAQALSSLDHPNISHFYGAGEEPDDKRVYVRTSYCGGGTLQQRMGKRRCSVEEALQITRDIAAGLAHAHKRRVIHQDIKPANVMFDDEGVVKIVDFGLAKLLGPNAYVASGASGGTLLYMAPEKLNGSRVDHRAEIFSLGGVLYELLAGEHPFMVAVPDAIVWRIGHDPHRRVTQIRRDLSASFDVVVDRALQKEPAARYQTADEFRTDIQKLIDKEDVLPPVPIPIRWKLLLAVYALAAIAALVTHVLLQKPLGVAVFAAERSSGTAEERALVDGLAHDITDRIRCFARGDPWLWAVSPDVVKTAELLEPKNIRGLFGAKRAIGIRITRPAPQVALELEGLDVSSSAESRGRTAIEIGRDFVSEDLDRVVRRSIGRRSRSSSPGYSASAVAYTNYLVGLGYLDAGAARLPQAIDRFTAAVTVDSTFARAWAMLGESYLRRFAATGDSTTVALCASACQRASHLSPECVEPYVTIGKLHAKRGQPEQAIDALHHALNIDKRYAPAHWELANVHNAAGRKKEADACYKRAVQTNQGDPICLGWQAYQHYKTGEEEEIKKAITPLKEITRLSPLNGQNYNTLGGCYYRLDCWEEAQEAWEASFRLEKWSPACANLGFLYYMNGRFKEALEMYQFAREYSPQSPGVINGIAAATYWIPGKREEAIALYWEATRLAEAQRSEAPFDGQQLAMLASLYAITRPDSAPVLAARAEAILPGDAEVAYRAALVYEVLGSREKALRCIGRALELKHSLNEVEREPFLETLRNDQRFELIAREHRRPKVECDELR